MKKPLKKPLKRLIKAVRKIDKKAAKRLEKLYNTPIYNTPIWDGEVKKDANNYQNLMDGFWWSESQQGHNYWHGIYTILYDKESA